MKLAMSILVRDEADIIADNIRFHAEQGVEQFVVTDNGSTDGSRELLEELSNSYPIRIFDEPTHTIDQDIWVTRMAMWLKDNTDADWVINNDSDEFWFSETRTLREALHEKTQSLAAINLKPGVLHCRRFNLLPDKSVIDTDTYRFFNNCFRVDRTLDSTFFDDGLNVLYTEQGTKVITRIDGLRSINMGNHDASHQASTADCDSIAIAHYPIRTYEQFVKKVTNHGSSIENNQRFGEDINWHLRAWYDMYKRGDLYNEYLKYVVSDDTKQQLIQQGVLSLDKSMEKYFIDHAS